MTGSIDLINLIPQRTKWWDAQYSDLNRTRLVEFPIKNTWQSFRDTPFGVVNIVTCPQFIEGKRYCHVAQLQRLLWKRYAGRSKMSCLTRDKFSLLAFTFLSNLLPLLLQLHGVCGWTEELRIINYLWCQASPYIFIEK